MKGIRVAGLSLLIALATSVAAVPAAQAALPEVGRCVKVATGTGTYRNGTCQTVATGELSKKYNWIPVSGTEKQTFSGSGLETLLTTVGHSTIKCIAGNLTGEYTGPKTASVEIEFQGCLNASEQQCQSVGPSAKSEIKTLPMEAELGFIRNQTIEGKTFLSVGLDLKPTPPLSDLMMYQCTGSEETAHVEGSVIGRVSPINKMTTILNHAYRARLGVQIPESFEGGPKDTLTTTFTSGLETVGSGASTLTLKEETGQNTNALEIKAKEN
jgi:hypothetical protein